MYELIITLSGLGSVEPRALAATSRLDKVGGIEIDEKPLATGPSRTTYTASVSRLCAGGLRAWGAAGAPEPAEKYSWAMRFGMDTRTHTHTHESHSYSRRLPALV